MKITALGIYGPYPKSGDHACSCYLVEYKDTSLVIDFGSGALSRLQETDISKVKYVCLTHYHYDHTSDLFPLVYMCEVTGQKFTLISGEDDSAYANAVRNNPCFKWQKVDESTVFKADDLTLRFFKMKHPVPTLAVLVEGDKKVAFSGDTVYNDNLPALLKNADMAFLDCSKPAGFKGPHMNVEIAKELAANFPSVRIITTHLNPDYDPTADLVGSTVEVAEEGKCYSI